MYIYIMPYSPRRELCHILDQNNKWEELGGIHMRFDTVTMQNLRKEIFRGNSPTDELLNLWGNQNHTVLELFILLGRMKHFHAMSIIKELVDEKYHFLMKDGDANLNRLMRNLAAKQEPKDCRIPPENFDDSDKILNVLKPVQKALSREDNESVEAVVIQQRKPSVSPGNLVHPKSPVPLIQVAGPSRALTVNISESAGGIPQIPYDDLKKSTNNWDQSTVLGKGGFGTVYKGTWKCTQVAVKKLEQKQDNPQSHNEQLKQSITELHCLNAYRHDNVLPLYGYSIDGPEPCLIYQYMSGGCLDNRLRIRDPLKVLQWPTRLKIAIGTARGLQFLHTIGIKPLIHGDIKSANILLDPNDMPRIGDFGLAREGPQSDYTHIKVSRIHGTRPYLPDEFLRAKKFSTKVDTYSFGVVLFEIATGLTAYSDRREDKFLKDHVVNYDGNVLDLKDRRAYGGEDCFRGLVEIGKSCVNKRAKDRPEMVNVLIQLEGVVS